MTFFPGSSRIVGRCVGVLESLGEGDPEGGFGGPYPFWDFRPSTEPFLGTGTPISSVVCSFLVVAGSGL